MFEDLTDLHKMAIKMHITSCIKEEKWNFSLCHSVWMSSRVRVFTNVTCAKATLVISPLVNTDESNVSSRLWQKAKQSPWHVSLEMDYRSSWICACCEFSSNILFQNVWLSLWSSCEINYLFIYLEWTQIFKEKKLSFCLSKSSAEIILKTSWNRKI